MEIERGSKTTRVKKFHNRILYVVRIKRHTRRKTGRIEDPYKNVRTNISLSIKRQNCVQRRFLFEKRVRLSKRTRLLEIDRIF